MILSILRIVCLSFFVQSIFFIPMTVWADQIIGMVKDSETNKAVVGASIFIPELKTGVLTDSEGKFSLAITSQGAYTLRVSRVGYETTALRVTIPGNTIVNVVLKPAPVVIDEIVTTARGRETARKDIPGSMAVVNASEIQESIPVSIPEVLSRKPGLAVSSDMLWSSRVVIRGLMKDQVILFVDGCRVVTATETAAEYGTIAGSDIERIEVLKGPISVLYGSGSTGGVVNIITRKGRFTEKPQFQFTLNPIYESAAKGLSMYERAEWSSSKAYISFSQYNRDYADYHAAGNRNIPNTQFRDRQSQVNFGLKLTPSQLLEARYQYFLASDVGIPGARSFPKDAVATYPKTTRELADLSWTWSTPFSWWKESSLKAYHQPIYREVELFPNTVTDSPGKRITPVSIYPLAHHNVYGARWQNIFTAGRHTLVAGIEGWQKNMESYRTKNVKVEFLDNSGAVTKTLQNVIEDRPLPDSRQRPVGVFAEDSFDLGKRLKLTLGGRADIISTSNALTFKQYAPPDTTVLWQAQHDTDRSWSFVAGAVYKALENLDLNLTLARSFRSPTIEERYLYADLGGTLTVGNPFLKSEKGAFGEAGFTTQLGNLKLTGQAYLNSLSDMVVQKWGTFEGRDAWVAENAGKARLWGFEAGADWVMYSDILLSGDCSFTRGANEKAHENLPFMPPPRGHVSLRLTMGKGIWVEPLLTLVYKQDKVAPGEITTPGYGIFDLSFGKTISVHDNLKQNLVFGVKNVGDKLYRDHLVTSRGYELYGLGRSFYTSWRLDY